MMRSVSIWLGSLILLLALPAYSQPAAPDLGFAYEQVRDRKAVELDFSQGYILVETDQMANIEFVKQATAAETERWEHFRLQAEAQHEIDPGNSEALVWPGAESQLRVRLDVLGRFERTRDVVLYLAKVPSGTYQFYAHNAYNTQDCACMGSVSFAVEAGVVTALRIERRHLGADGAVLAERPKKGTALEQLMRSALQLTPPTPLAFDKRLPSDKIVAANFSPVAEIPNWGRYIVNRILPIEGLFRYEREELVPE